MRSKTFDNLAPDKQDRILDAAVDEFANHGFHQASVNRMVGRLGIAKGSLFKYFGSKEGLFQQVFEHAVNMLKGPLKTARSAEGDTFDRLRLSLAAGLDFVRAHPRLYRIYLKVLFQENIPFREPFLRQVRGYSAKFLRPLLEDGVAKGELRADLDLDMAIFLIDGLFDRLLQSLTVPEMHPTLYDIPDQNAQQRMDQLMDFIRRALAAHTGDTNA
ncbi:transcriptional regulator, TetR family [Paucidesulfovibrio gracilis DSM 16080]|uniref:Transcriptional regulator, TetR family n=1 Tax=Paucidesulfovibrio gracilis DSM 16080 TaxID=1121449 RepID=A0A1T4WCR1_9BACT|nr:TetR/AcrR family transcriptional regulator [Paucidesulfovibrio gracilis]SKA74808.1 transcriptional regulator, TetR family [Paucidesulfovibrio gracilis DSM 16080]